MHSVQQVQIEGKLSIHITELFESLFYPTHVADPTENCINHCTLPLLCRYDKPLWTKRIIDFIQGVTDSLPKELRAITNVNSFKAHIKTYLFKTLYW